MKKIQLRSLVLSLALGATLALGGSTAWAHGTDAARVPAVAQPAVAQPVTASKHGPHDRRDHDRRDAREERGRSAQRGEHGRGPMVRDARDERCDRDGDARGPQTRRGPERDHAPRRAPRGR